MQMIETKADRMKWTEEAIRLRDNLTLEEKISLMSGNLTVSEMKMHSQVGYDGLYYLQNVFRAGGIPQKKIPEMKFCDGSRGIIGGMNNTCYPSPMCRGASFDRKLERRIGQALATETKENGGNLFAGICINLLYHPGWGRSQETYGEDSYHIGEMGSAIVEGVQKENVIACIKHFAFNSMEYSRFRVNITCNKRTEREVFLPHFKKCIDHGAAAVMSAYNSYQGAWCGENEYLLEQVLKSEWDFDGFVMSDFVLGIRDTVESANHGMDMEMCIEHWFGNPLLKAVKAGRVSEEKIDCAALRIIRTLLAAEEGHDKGKRKQNIRGDYASLALQAAREGITLIKNDGILPLSKENTRKILVLGRLGDKENVGDHSMDWIKPPYVVTPVQGILNIALDAEVIYYDGKNLEHAERLAKSADAVIFVVGYDEEDEGECATIIERDGSFVADTSCTGDRNLSLGLHEEEIKLLNTVGLVNKNSVAVLIGGSMIMLDEWKKSVGAILMAYYPGMEGGTAIAEIIFGDVNPSGKLPFVVPYKETDLPKIQWETDEQLYDYYHGYTKLEKDNIEPVYPFGYGLSYTSFEVSDSKVEVSGDNLNVFCTVKNTGDRSGDEVIQMYVGFDNSKVERPVKLLRGFERVSLEPGEEKRVEISCNTEELKWYNPETESWEMEHMEYQVYCGTSSDEKELLKNTVEL